MSIRQIQHAPVDQLLCWWENVELIPGELSHDEAIDEVANALSKQGDDGIATLKRFLESDDARRRKAALYALAWPETSDDEIRSALVRAFASSDDSVKCVALWGFIHLGYFPISHDRVMHSMEAENGRLAALSMVYLSRANPNNATVVLRNGLRSPNPRMREYACDEIGDREMRELVADLRPLLNDEDAYVAQAAESNLAFFE